MQLCRLQNNDLNIYKGKYYEDDEDEEFADIEEGYSSLESMCTLRRAAAFAFEHLSKVSGKIWFESISEIIGKHLQDGTDIVGREAAILVLGVIADSDASYEHIVPYLKDLLPILGNFLDDDQNKIKTTTWWTISKFFSYIIEESYDDIVVIQ